jgi:hypothetical protein
MGLSDNIEKRELSALKSDPVPQHGLPGQPGGPPVARGEWVHGRSQRLQETAPAASVGARAKPAGLLPLAASDVLEWRISLKQVTGEVTSLQDIINSAGRDGYGAYRVTDDHIYLRRLS